MQGRASDSLVSRTRLWNGRRSRASRALQCHDQDLVEVCELTPWPHHVLLAKHSNRHDIVALTSTVLQTNTALAFAFFHLGQVAAEVEGVRAHLQRQQLPCVREGSTPAAVTAPKVWNYFAYVILQQWEQHWIHYESSAARIAERSLARISIKHLRDELSMSYRHATARQGGTRHREAHRSSWQHGGAQGRPGQGAHGVRGKRQGARRPPRP